MRFVLLMPIMTGFVLAACSSGGADADGDGKVAQEEAVGALASMDAPRPGQYRTTFEMQEFNMPGMPKGMIDQMSGSIGGNFSMTYCQTESDNEDAVRQMTDNMGRGDCTYNTFEVSGNSFTVDMTCTPPDGGAGTYKMTGTTSSEGTDMQMEMQQQMPGMQGGPMTMKAHMTSERIGDCADAPAA